jgi:SRSO17 transposase
MVIDETGDRKKGTKTDYVKTKIELASEIVNELIEYCFPLTPPDTEVET